MMKRLPYMLLLMSVLVLTACGQTLNTGGGLNAPWSVTKDSKTLKKASQNNEIQQIEPSIDWKNPNQIQNSVELPPNQTTSITQSIPRAPQQATNASHLTTTIPQPIQETSVKVALLAPLSGPHQAVGESLLNAAQLALFDVGNDHFELIPRDTQGTEIGARQAAQSALNDGADLILGPLFSANTKAVSAVASSKRKPVISFSTDWNIAGRNTYVMGFLPFTQVARVTNYALARGYDQYGLFAPENRYSRMVDQTLKSVLASSSGRITKSNLYPIETADLKENIEYFVNENSQNNFNALMIPLGGQSLKTVAAFMGHYRLDNTQVKILGTGLWDDPALISEPILHGAWFAAPDPKLRKSFEAKYTNTYGKAPIRIASLAYDGAALAAILAQTANGAPASEAFSKERLTSKQGFSGIDGIFRFRNDGLIERGLAVQEIRASGIRVIDPAPRAFFINQ